jgi:phosphotransferase system  glucose/maltose/N-acetylglucosamine-specific IIC component
MGQFLRFVAIMLLVLTGFGTGICGLFGIGITLTDAQVSRSNDAGVILVISAVCLVVAIGCFFAVRALIRRLHAADAARRVDSNRGPG